MDRIGEAAFPPVSPMEQTSLPVEVATELLIQSTADLLRQVPLIDEVVEKSFQDEAAKVPAYETS
jgi:hypothetical protein